VRYIACEIRLLDIFGLGKIGFKPLSILLVSGHMGLRKYVMPLVDEFLLDVCELFVKG
jgi:hypothetical protein